MAALIASLAVGRARAEEFTRGQYRFSTGAEPAFVVRSDVPQTWPGDAPGANDDRWRYWLYDVQVDHRGGAERTFADHVYEVRSASLLGDAGRFQIEFKPDFQTLAIHRVEVRRAGRWTSRLDPARISLARREGEFEQDIADGTVTALIVLDDVRVGDLVRIAYTVDGGNPVLAGQDTDWLRIGFQSPLLDVRSRMLFDRGTRLTVHRENTDDGPRIVDGADSVVASYSRHGIPAYQDPGNRPRWYQPFPAFQVGPAQSWSDVVRWALPLYPAVQGPLPADLESRIAEWRKLPDPVSRLTAALRSVQDDVRYFGLEMGETSHRPHAPADTWTRRFGDCKDKAYLLATVLARLDIAAVPALVSSADGRAVRDYVPSADVFDHVIVRARIGDATVWLDPTISQQGGDPRRVDLGELGVALPIDARTSALEPIPPPAQVDAAIEARERFEIAGDASSATLAVETTYRGASADSARRRFASERIDDTARRYVDYYAKRYRKAEPQGVPRIDDDRASNVLIVREAYRLPSPFEVVAGNERALDFFAEALDVPAALPERLDRGGPLHVGARARYRHRIEVIAPAQWSPLFGEDSVERGSGALAFERGVSRDGTRVSVNYDLDVTSSDLAADAVPAHIDAIRQLRDDLSIRLRYRLPSSIDTHQREDRLKALLRDALKDSP